MANTPTIDLRTPRYGFPESGNQAPVTEDAELRRLQQDAWQKSKQRDDFTFQRRAQNQKQVLHYSKRTLAFTGLAIMIAAPMSAGFVPVVWAGVLATNKIVKTTAKVAGRVSANQDRRTTIRTTRANLAWEAAQAAQAVNEYTSSRDAPQLRDSRFAPPSLLAPATMTADLYDRRRAEIDALTEAYSLSDAQVSAPALEARSVAEVEVPDINVPEVVVPDTPESLFIKTDNGFPNISSAVKDVYGEVALKSADTVDDMALGKQAIIVARRMQDTYGVPRTEAIIGANLLDVLNPVNRTFTENQRDVANGLVILGDRMQQRSPQAVYTPGPIAFDPKMMAAVAVVRHGVAKADGVTIDDNHDRGVIESLGGFDRGGSQLWEEAAPAVAVAASRRGELVAAERSIQNDFAAPAIVRGSLGRGLS